MLSSILKHIFSLPGNQDDTLTNLIARRLHVIALALLAMTIVYSITWLFLQPELVERLVFSVYMALVCLIIVILLRSGYVDIARHFFLASFWLLVTVVAASAGGTRAPFFSLYIVNIMSAVIFSGWRTATFYGFLTFISGGIMVYLANQGMIPEPFATPASAFLTQASIIVLIVVDAYIIVRDMQRNMEHAGKAYRHLEESEQRFRLISSVTSDYTFSSKLNEAGELEHTLLTGAFEKITGYTPEEFIRIGGWRSTVHPDDKEIDARDFELLQQNHRISSELRIIRKGGEVRYVRVYALPVFDEAGKHLIRINGGVQDITAEKHLELQLRAYTSGLEDLVNERTQELRQARDQLELVLQNATDALAFANTQGDILISNPAFNNYFNAGESQAIEYILWSLVSDEQLVDVSSALLQTLYDGQERHFETKIRVDDSEKDIDMSFIPVTKEENGNTGKYNLLLSGHDITHIKEIERFKEQFVADAVHDLATPIAGMTTRLYLLKRSPEKLEEHVKALDNQIGHLRNLLDGLRTLSQIDRNTLVLDRESVDINEIIQRVYDTYEPVALEKRQTMRLNLESGLPALMLDIRLIERVLVNLISNAVNYTAEAKEIQIVSRQVDSGIRIEVIDRGIGISEDEQKHIFERFYRSDEARVTRSGGTGLGLAITKQIVELHGGHITVSSTPGEGSTFSVVLPLTENSNQEL